MLTVPQMHAAYFARRLDLDPDLRSLPEAKRPIAAANEAGADPEALAAQYQEGKDVLAKYTLSVSSRYQRGCVPDSARPTDAAGTILVSAGYIATSEACRVAIFRPRK